MINLPDLPSDTDILSMSSYDYQLLSDDYFYIEGMLDGVRSVLFNLMNDSYNISPCQRDQLKNLYDKYSSLLTECENRQHHLSSIRHGSK